MSRTHGACANVRDIYKVHATFRREFGLSPALVRGVASGDTERAQIIADHIKLLVVFLEEHHHSEDAVVWPRLLYRAPKDVNLVVRLMEGHHQSIDKLSTEIGAALAPWRASAAPENGEALAGALDRLIAVLNEHMGLEEKVILPIVERHIFATEWEQMVNGGAARIPAEYAPVIIGMLMYEGGVEIVPPQARPALQDVAAQAYAAHAKRVHGTATPPRSSDFDRRHQRN